MSTRTKNVCSALFLVALCAPAGGAFAQDLPGSADPARLEERFREPATSPVEEIAPLENSKIDRAIPEAEEGFVLEGVTLEGVTAFPVSEFDGLIGEYTGRKVDLGTLQHLAARITNFYRTRGYFLSRALVPEQEISEGVVVIRVIEGHVSNVTIDDPDGLLKNDPLGLTEGVIARVKAIAPLHGPTLERYALLLNQSYGIYVQSILTAPKDGDNVRAGAIDIALKVTKNPSAFSVSYDNHGSRFVGPHQATAEWVGGNVLNAYDRLELQASTSIPVREVQYGSFSYTIPVTSSGLTANTAFSYSNSRPGHTLKPLEVEGDSTFFEAGLSYPVILTRKTSLDIGLGFQIHNTATEFLDEELIDDKLRILVLNASLQTQDSWKGDNRFDLSLNQGVDILGATETGSADLSRGRGHSDFTSLKAEASRDQELPKNFELTASVAGQYTQVPLLSSQEFGFGGANFGRAYDPSEITGDQGVAASLEARYAGIDPVMREKLRLVPFAFYDIGKVWNEDAGQDPVSAASAGFGTYYNIDNKLSGALQMAYPLTKSVSEPIMNGDNGPRILFSIRTTF